MEIEVRDEIKENYVLQTGDIASTRIGENTTFYIVKKESSGYRLRNLTDTDGATGYKKTLKELTNSLNLFDSYIIYPKSEYKLVLERK